ncbi:MAG: TIGR01777 family oxidoreductase [Solirubrobacteraceae bacterium]
MCALRVTITGATGLIGPSLVAALRERDAQVTVLTRDPARATALTDLRSVGDVQAVAWQPLSEPAPADALAGRDAVLHLAGEPVAQRWSAKVKRAIHDSRVIGTRNLVEGLARAGEADTGGRPRTLISSSATGYYGAHGEEPLDEDAPPGEDFLARACVEWESAAAGARELGVRVVQVRTGVVLDRSGGALAKMLPPFRLGIGGPVAGGRQYISWIHAHDVIGIMLAALEDERWSGPINATAPDPVPNRVFSKALGRVLGRPSLLPVPGLALRALYGEMAEIVTSGARVMPAKALVLGYEFEHPQLEQALRSALTR